MLASYSPELILLETAFPTMNSELLAKAKSLGFSDRQISNLTGRTEDEVRAERKRLGLVELSAG